MIEHSHLKIIRTLHRTGTLTEAANVLCLSQSALSHQIRYLEKKLGIALWEREGRNLRLTQAGKVLLRTAQQVLPVIEQAEQTLKAYSEGKQGVLRIGVECYPCYEWLTQVIRIFLKKIPDMDIEIIDKFQFSGMEGLLNHHIDILTTPDMEKNKNVHYETVMEYELVLLLSTNHKLANITIDIPDKLSEETLFTFPVATERLDVLTNFFNPACVKPAKIKRIESIELMLQMVALQRGICVLPEWLSDHYTVRLSLKKSRLGANGIHQKLFVAMRKKDINIPYIQEFISIGKHA